MNENLMTIVIIGNGAAGISAAEEIRMRSSSTRIVMISKETSQPYSKVLLPYYLKGKVTDAEKLFIRPGSFYEQNAIDFITGTVKAVDETKQCLTLVDGSLITYDKLLIATGSSPFMPPIPGLDGNKVFHLWTRDDACQLKQQFLEGKRVLIIGSGFVALQAAWAAVVNRLDVTIYELMPRIMPRVVDDHSAQVLLEKVIQAGVTVKTDIQTEKVEQIGTGDLRVHAKGQLPIEVDFIIVGTGVRPNTLFLKDSSVEHQRGIVVNGFMQTNVPHIYAAGDVTSGPTVFNENTIHALWPTAIEQGKIAAINMLGQNYLYSGSLNMNVTEMFHTTVASIGKFLPEAGKDAWIYHVKEDGLFQLILEDKIPVGASLIGPSEFVEYLGILRPLIKNKRPLACEKTQLFEYLRTLRRLGKPIVRGQEDK